MSNEELAIRVKNGDADADLLLWNAVQRFVAVMATRYIVAHENSIEPDDLIQSGYIAMRKAANAFEPERGRAFLTVLGYYLKTSFAETAGTRTIKRDALLYCDSLNRPAFESQEDGGELLDYIEDDTSECPFIDVEQMDFVKYTRSIISAALETLEPVQQALLIDRYLNNKSWKYCAAAYGLESRSTASDMAQRATNKLKVGKYSKQLRECLDGYNEYNGYKQAARSSGAGAFIRYGVSSIEAVALLKEGGFENE